MLIHFGVKPYLVFDGDHLPSKARTEASRYERRKDAKKEGLELLNLGKTAQAHKTLQKAIDVTPQMTHDLIQELKKLNVAYVVAPYEADAQLAYLEKKGMINGVLSEDSDLLVFGVQRLLTKLDQYGNCVEVNRNEFSACKDISLIGWTDADFRRMAILSGCDYLENLPNMGLKTAYRLVRRHKSIDKILRMIQFDGVFVPADYATKFEQAERSFLHHRVFCPIAKELVLLTEITRGLIEEDMPYLGTKVDAETAILVAFGELDPMTKAPISARSHDGASQTSLSSNLTFGENRRHTVGTTEDLKSNKKINSFFKKRMPLAELDPNSLTPSPSQQRLLQRHSNVTWVGTPSPNPVVQTAQSVPRLSTHAPNTETFLSRAATLSDYNPPKRQRLCSDTEEVVDADDGVASPFFSSATGPILNRISAKVKKARRSNFGIFSDDSVEDILVQISESTGENNSNLFGPTPQLPESSAELTFPEYEPSDEQLQAENSDVENADLPLKPVDNNSEEVELVPASSPPNEEPNVSVTLRTQTSSASISQNTNSVSQSTAPSSVDPDDDSFVDLLEYHVHNQNVSLAQKFSYQDSATESSKEIITRLQACTNPSTSSSVKNKNRVQAEADRVCQIQQDSAECIRQTPAEKIQIGIEAVTASGDHKARRPMTPLQQLSQSVLCRTTSVPNLSTCQSSSIQKGKPLARHSTTIQAGSLHKCLRESDQISLPVGSEDLILPTSEDEGDKLSEDDDLPKHRPVLNLDRFSFKANTLPR